MTERLFTIGVYGFTPEAFFAALAQANIDLFLDLRRRRGVRGREYAFANAGRLQEELAGRGITYRHVIGLAPEIATRDLQHRENAANRVAKRQQAALSPAFAAEYTSITLDPFDWDTLLPELEKFQRPVLFCVERTPAACHRGLVAARLSTLTGVPVTDLVP